MSNFLVRASILLIALSIWSILAFSQGTNMEYTKIQVGDATNLKEANDPFIGIDKSPGTASTIALSSIKRGPLFIFDYEAQEIIKEIDVGDWYAGSKINYSSKGTYILLQQLIYVDFAPNKDREIDFEIVNVGTGEMVKRFDNYHSVKFTPDEKYVIALTGDEISFWNLETGENEKQFTVTEATNSIAISPDGTKIAVSHKPDSEALKNIPRYQSKDGKKALKSVIKYKQMISFYDASSFEYLGTVNELYDIVYRLEYSGEGDYLMCQSIVHDKIQSSTNAARQNFVQIIDAKTGEPHELILPSQHHYEPDFDLSPDKRLIGITGLGKFAELRIYDFATGRMLGRFELSYRLLENFREGEFPNDGRFSFKFSDDSRSVLMTSGNRLLIWNMNL